MLRTFAESGRPLPPFSPDDVVDFQVTEAVLIAAERDKQKDEKAQQRREEREREGLAGHRSDDFLERARAAEAEARHG